MANVEHQTRRLPGNRIELHPKGEMMNLHLTRFRSLSALVCSALLGVACIPTAALLHAQMANMPAEDNAPMPSPPATADVSVAGGTIHIAYNTPHMRGRKIMGDLVPYGQVWRTGANPATTIVTSAPLKFGTLLVPAGTHTLYSLPSQTTWQLILNKQTGQWGTEYKPEMDLGRVPMKSKAMSSPQEVMSLSFENTTATSTELHIRWETTDEYVTITKP
jgi:Protein of unknown function (DUF2911)